jgi:hypothetical protein
VAAGDFGAPGGGVVDGLRAHGQCQDQQSGKILRSRHEVFTVLFLVFKLISTSENMSDSSRQSKLGIPMAVVLGRLNAGRPRIRCLDYRCHDI